MAGSKRRRLGLSEPSCSEEEPCTVGDGTSARYDEAGSDSGLRAGKWNPLQCKASSSCLSALL